MMVMKTQTAWRALCPINPLASPSVSGPPVKSSHTSQRTTVSPDAALSLSLSPSSMNVAIAITHINSSHFLFENICSSITIHHDQYLPWHWNSNETGRVNYE